MHTNAVIKANINVKLISVAKANFFKNKHLYSSPADNWKFVTKITGKKKQRELIDEQKANTLNKEFAQVFEASDLDNIKSIYSNQTSNGWPVLSTLDVYKELRRIKKFTPGPDQLARDIFK